MKNFLLSAIQHWKTSTAGIAGALLIIANSYQAGMNWKQWALAAAVALLGLSAHDGVVKPAAVALFVLLFGGTAMAQAPATEPIEITASAVSLPGSTGGTLAATLAGTQINITPNVGVEEINLLTSGGSTNAFMAGYSDRHLGPLLSKALNNSSPWLNGYNFRVGLHSDVGVARIADSTGNVRQHFGALFGGTFDYAIKGSSTWSLAARVDDFFTKGLPHHHNLVVALGPVIHF